MFDWIRKLKKQEPVFGKAAADELEHVEPLKRKLRIRRYRHDASVHTVLVEDEERICRFWREYFDKKGMSIETYQTPEAFMHSFQPKGDTQFYFDQDFGRQRGVGLRLSKMVQDWPCRFSTALVTAYPPSIFDAMLASGVIDRVLDKFPRDIFPYDFFERRMQQEIEEVGRTEFIRRELHRLLAACDDGLESLESIRSDQGSGGGLCGMNAPHI